MQALPRVVPSTATLWRNVHLATLVDGRYGLIRDGALVARGGHIAWLGRATDLPAMPALDEHDGGGGWLVPGLIDCHTHIVYAGTRAAEFEARLRGKSYSEIARAGGGILATVRATRAADDAALLEESLPRITALLSEGVTTLEIKSGYGLDLASERKLLRVAQAVGKRFPVQVVRTFLGAHAVPPEFEGNADGYVAHLCQDMLPALVQEGWVDALDAFCETIGFSAQHVEQMFAAARAYALPVKLHAEQLSDQGGALIAARYGALSVDHLEHLPAGAAPALAAAGTVAVLLPGAYYYLGETRLPPIDALRRAAVAMAVATDCNPGSSPITSVLTAMNMACVLFRLTPEEALAGVTLRAAQALGMARDRGSLEVGKRADVALMGVNHPCELAYGLGLNPCRAVMRG